LIAGTRALHYQLKDPHPPKVSDVLSSLEFHAAVLSFSLNPTNQLLVLLGKCGVQVGEGAAMAESLIGSRPPRCDGKCAPCGRCEAVQVPVAPRVDSSRGGEGEAAEPRRRGRDGLLGKVEESYTDYKPLNWRCRCADRRALDP
jgi:hypothetical protein